MPEMSWVWVPSVAAFVPPHPFPAVQEVAPPETVQVRVVVSGAVPVVGLAERVTEGAGGFTTTVTLSMASAVPVLWQVMSKI